VNEYVKIQFADAVYTEIPVDNNNNTIKPNSSINLTNYNVRATFKTQANNMITLQLRNTTAITYNKDSSNVVINDSNHIEKYYVNSTSSQNDLSANINNQTIDVYYNGEFITSINNNNTTLTPTITYNNISVNNFYVTANDQPVTIDYKLSQATLTTAGLLTLDNLKSLKAKNTNINPSIGDISAGLNENDMTTLQNYFNNNKILYTNYIITTLYKDNAKNNTISVALAGLNSTLYSVTIDNNNKLASFKYYYNNMLFTAKYNIIPQSINNLTIDVNYNVLSVTLNNNTFFSQPIDKLTDGVVLFDYTDLTITKSQIEDRNTGSITTFQNQSSLSCNPILMNKYIYTGSASIEDKGFKEIQDKAVFNQTFDIAKVQISLENGQEIHYWVKLI